MRSAAGACAPRSLELSSNWLACAGTGRRFLDTFFPDRESGRRNGNVRANGKDEGKDKGNAPFCQRCQITTDAAPRTSSIVSTSPLHASRLADLADASACRDVSFACFAADIASFATFSTSAFVL
jgi:hypothetical protein